MATKLVTITISLIFYIRCSCCAS